MTLSITHALGFAHEFRAQHGFLLFVLLFEQGFEFVFDRAAVERLQFFGPDLDAELRQDLGLETVPVPSAGMGFFGAADVYDGRDQAIHHVHHARLLIVTLEQIPAHPVDRLALLVHHVVVFENVFARAKILRLDGFLRGCDTLADEATLDRHVLFHAQAQHKILHPLPAEDAQQIVLQRKIEPRAARIALAAGAPAQLVVDAPGFVPLVATMCSPPRATTSS
jgi:hypothetical protein